MDGGKTVRKYKNGELREQKAGKERGSWGEERSSWHEQARSGGVDLQIKMHGGL